MFPKSQALQRRRALPGRRLLRQRRGPPERPAPRQKRVFPKSQALQQEAGYPARRELPMHTAHSAGRVQSSQSCFRIRQTGPELRVRAADRREPGPSAGAAYRICCRSGRPQRPPHRSSGSGAQTRQPERPPDGRFWCRRRRRTENRKESLRRTAGI